MADGRTNIGSKSNSNRANNPGEIIMAGAIPGVEATIKDLLQNLSEGISKTMASFYVGEDQVKNPTDLGNKSKQKAGGTSILGNTKSIYSLLDDIKSAIGTKHEGKTIKSAINNIDSTLDKFINTSFIEFGEIMNTNTESILGILRSLAVDFDFIPNIYTQLDQLSSKILSQKPSTSNTANNIDPNITKSINILNNSIEELIKVNKSLFKNKLPDQKTQIELIISGLNDDALDSLLQLVKLSDDKKTVKALKNFMNIIQAFFEFDKENVKSLKENIDLFNEMIQKISVLGQSADQAEAAAQKIKNVNHTIVETAVDVNNHQKEIKESIVTINGLNSFMITATIVMSIGALFMMMGGGKFVENALLFGVVLGVFELLIITPVLLFHKDSATALQGLKELNSFMVSCTIMMLVGALFMSLSNGALVKNALLFGVVLMLFEALVVAPFILFNKEKNAIFGALDNFKSFLITTTILLLVGALFMQLGGGKMVISALAFGFVLMTFEALVVAPFIIYSKLSNQINNSFQDFAKLITVCTIIMLVGALFVQLGGGKFVKDALIFGGVLMTFEALVVAPFLLFSMIDNKIFSGLAAFTKVIVASTIVLLVGALFMRLGGGKMALAALEFTGLLAAFETLVIAPFLLYRGVAPVVNKSLKDFALVVLASTFVLILGATYMKLIGWESTVGYAVLLSAFIGIIGGIAIWISHKMNSKTLAQMEMFGTFILMSTAALGAGALFIKLFGSGPVWEYALLLTLFVSAMGGVVLLLTNFMGPQTLPEMVAFGTFVLLSSAALSLGAFFIATYGANSVIEYALCLLGFIGVMSLVMVALTALSPFMLVGEGVLVALAVSTGLMTAVFFALNELFSDDPGAEQLKANIIALGSVISIDLVALYKSLSDVMGWYVIEGSVAAVAIGNSLFVLGSSLGIVNLIIGKHGKQLEKNILILNSLIGPKYLANTFSLLGLLSPLIALGSIAAIALGVSLTILGGSISLVNLMMGNRSNVIKKNIETLNTVIGKLAETYKYIYDNFGLLFLLKVGLQIQQISGITISLSVAIRSIAKATQEMKKAGDISKYTKAIIKNICSFFNIIENPEIVNYVDNIKNYKKKIEIITGVCLPMAKMIGKLANIVQDMANLKIAIAWDEKGNAIGYRKLKDKDFDLMTKNVGEVVTSLTRSLMQAYVKQFKCGDKVTSLEDLVKDKSILKNVMSFNKDLGKVISNIASAIGNMANLKVATKWDEHGKPIDFRSLKEKDFTNAYTNVGRIITNMTQSLINAYNINSTMFEETSKGLFSRNSTSPISKVIKSSMEISTLIGNIASAIQDVAVLNMPIKWEDGKPVEFRPMKPSDFTTASTNIQTVLMVMFEALQSLYNDHQDLFKSDDDGGWFGLFKKEKKTPIAMVLESSFKISELISNVGEGIQSIAKMMVPDQWDPKTGKPIHFNKLESQDFTDAATSISTILTTTAEALATIKINPKHVEKVSTALVPISELIANMADGVLKFAAGQIPYRWNKDGKPIEYINITEEKYEEAGRVIGKMLTSTADALVKAYNGGAENLGLKAIVEGQDFQATIEAFTGVTSIVSNIADGVIHFASAQIPDQWSQDGKAIHYKDIKDWTTIQNNLSSVLDKIITCVANTVISVYNGSDNGKSGLKDLLEGGPDSPFISAVNGIQGITKIVSGLVDSVIHIGQAQIPYDWDKDGKPIKFKNIDVNAAISDIKKIFQGDGENGLLTILCGQMKNIADNYFNEDSPENNISESIASITSGLGSILGVVKTSIGIINDIANLKIPKNFDNEGKATGYDKFDTTAMEKVKTNITSIITNLFWAVDDAWSSPSNNGKILSKSSLVTANGEPSTTLTTILSSIESIVDVIQTVVSGTSELLNSENSLEKLISYKSKSGATDNTDLTLGLFIDIYAMMKNFNSISSQFNNNELLSNLSSDNFTSENVNKYINSISGINTIMTTLVDSYSNISETFTANDKVLQNMNIENSKKIITDILTLYSDLSKVCVDDEDNTNNKFPELKDLNKGIMNKTLATGMLANFAISLVNNLNEISNIYETFKKINKDNVIATIPNSIQSIIKIYNNEPIGKESPGIYQLIRTMPTDKIENIQNIKTSLLSLTSLSQLLMVYAIMITKSYLTNKNIIDDYNQNNLFIRSAIKNIINDVIYINEQIKNVNQSNNIDKAINPIYSFFELIGDNDKGFISKFSKIIQAINANDIIKHYDENKDQKLSTLLTPVIKDVLKVAELMSNIDASKKELSIAGIKISINKNILESVNSFKAAIDQIVVTMENSKNITPVIIDALKKNLTSLTEIFNIKIETSWGKTNLDIVSESLGKYIDTVIRFNPMALMNASTLRISIEQIYSSMSSQKSTNTFKANTDLLAKYVKTINSIDLRRTNALTQLVRELNELAKKMGNLDNLTDALANRLSYVLNELANRLEESKETINKADEIQIRRHNKITEAIKNVQTLIQQPLNIVVKSQAPDDTPNPDNGDEGGDTGGATPSHSIKVDSTGNTNGQGGTTPDSAKQARGTGKPNTPTAQQPSKKK